MSVAGQHQDLPLPLLADRLVEERCVAVGSHRGRFTEYLSGSKVELSMFLGDRINVNISREGKHEPAALVALALELDLDGLAALAPGVPAPAPR